MANSLLFDSAYISQIISFVISVVSDGHLKIEISEISQPLHVCVILLSFSSFQVLQLRLACNSFFFYLEI